VRKHLRRSGKPAEASLACVPVTVGVKRRQRPQKPCHRAPKLTLDVEAFVIPKTGATSGRCNAWRPGSTGVQEQGRCGMGLYGNVGDLAISERTNTARA
jgi:hypothetical protein